MWSRQPSFEFVSRMWAMIREIIEEIPSYEAMADRESDAQVSSRLSRYSGLCALSGHRFTVAIGDSKGHESVGIEFNAV